METRVSGAAPTPEEARQSLHLAEQEESATVNRPVPGWYFPTLATLLLMMFLLNALGRPDQPVRGIVGGLVIACALLVGSWIWAVCGIILAGLLATAGTRYWQQTRRA